MACLYACALMVSHVTEEIKSITRRTQLQPRSALLYPANQTVTSIVVGHHGCAISLHQKAVSVAAVRRGAGVPRGARAHPGAEGQAHPAPGCARGPPLQGDPAPRPCPVLASRQQHCVPLEGGRAVRGVGSWVSCARCTQLLHVIPGDHAHVAGTGPVTAGHRLQRFGGISVCLWLLVTRGT